MAIKIFISYSHKDESYKEALTEHLSSLRRSGIVSDWNDRKIVPGQNWANEISENLKSSDLILFLISSSFMSSEYCVNIEAKTALSMHKSGTALLIPIVVRPVDWSDSELSEVQGLPKDAKAVTTWEDEDEAWVNVIQGIKEHLKVFHPARQVTSNPQEGENITPSDWVVSWLDDTEIILTHRRVNKILLNEVYTTPDLKLDEKKIDDLNEFVNSKDFIHRDGNFLILGEEQQGKTSLLKYFYKNLLQAGSLPIYLDAKKINTTDTNELVERAIKEQYMNLDSNHYLSQESNVVLIDNIDELALNSRYRETLLDRLDKIFCKIICTAHVSFGYISNDIFALNEFIRCELLGLGHKKREELIRNWLTLGVRETISDEELYANCDELKDRINNVVKKNIVPPKPIYILMLLQMFEAQSNLNLELSSHGHCYQQLIYQALDNANVDNKEFDKYLNVLTELSWWIFTNQTNPNAKQLDDFFHEYGQNFLTIDKNVVMKKLVGHSILCENNFRIGFKYPYIYYFFVGKKIAESYNSSDSAREQVEYLLKNLHREDFANIIIFIAHHTKEAWVLAKIQTVLLDLFSSQSQATLDKEQLSFMDDFMKQIPDLIVEQREIQEERDKHHDELDEQERRVAPTPESDAVSLDIFAQINKTFKGMEISGQIIRNRHASIKKDILTTLAEDGINAGLRFLKYFLEISDVAKNEIIKVISHQLISKPNLSDKEVERHAEHAYLSLTYGVVSAFVRKISTSVGSKEAMEIYAHLESKAPTPAMLLLRQAIELHFTKKVDMPSIINCIESLKDNPVCTRILKELIVQHIYLFPVNYKEKQQLSSLLGLSVKGQQVMGNKQKKVAG